MNPLETYYLIGTCLGLENNHGRREQILSRFSQPGFDWDAVVFMGSNHFVLPAIYISLKNAELLPALPSEVSEHLERICQMNEDRNRKVMEQADRLKRVLRYGGFSPVFIKGAASIIGGLYPEPAARMLSDIDLVIQESEIHETVELLKGDGYSHASMRKEDWPFMHHFPTLSHPDEPASVDLHFLPVGRRYSHMMSGWETRLENCEFPSVRSDSYSKSREDGKAGSQKSNIPFLIPSSEDSLVLNFLHSQLQDRGDFMASVSLRSLYEFYLLRKRTGLENPAIIKKPGLLRKYRRYVALCDRTFDQSEPGPKTHSLSTRAYLIRFEYRKRSRTYYRVSTFSRRTLDRLGHFARVITHSFFYKSYRTYLFGRLTDREWWSER